MPTKRDVLQREIARQVQKLQMHPMRSQKLRFLLAWKEESEYRKKNKSKTAYARRPIIDREKPTRTCRTIQKRRQWKTTQEYIDLNDGEPLRISPIAVLYYSQRITGIRNFIHTKKS